MKWIMCHFTAFHQENQNQPLPGPEMDKWLETESTWTLQHKHTWVGQCINAQQRMALDNLQLPQLQYLSYVSYQSRLVSRSKGVRYVNIRVQIYTLKLWTEFMNKTQSFGYSYSRNSYSVFFHLTLSISLFLDSHCMCYSGNFLIVTHPVWYSIIEPNFIIQLVPSFLDRLLASDRLSLYQQLGINCISEI